MSNKLKQYVEEGFEPITEWEWRDGKIRLASLDWDEHAGWLYAFVIESEVKYVGLTRRVLRSRMDNYRDLTEEQCVRLRGLITTECKSGTTVRIFGRRMSGDHAELEREEAKLREIPRPVWNRM